jgi:hypothetical protein
VLILKDIVFGAAIAIVSSVVTTIFSLILTNRIQRIGNVKIFYRFVCMNGDDLRWGINDRSDKEAFYISLRIEIYNTTNSMQIIRDLSARLYNEKNFVAVMVPVEYEQGRPEKRVFGDDTRYSFAIQPRTIQQYELRYFILVQPSLKEVNKIRLTYYDSNNRERGGNIIECDNLINQKSRERSEWIEL